MKNINRLMVIAIFLTGSVSLAKHCPDTEKAKLNFVSVCRKMAAFKIAFNNTITGGKVENNTRTAVQNFCSCASNEIKNITKKAEEDCDFNAQVVLSLIDPQDQPGKSIAKKCQSNPANK